MVWLREINAEVWDQFPLSPDQILKLHSTKATFNWLHQIIWKRCYDSNIRCWVPKSSVLNWDYSLLFDTLRHHQGRCGVMCGWGHLTSDHVLFENFMLPPIMFDAFFFNPCMNSRNLSCVGCSPYEDGLQHQHTRKLKTRPHSVQSTTACKGDSICGHIPQSTEKIPSKETITSVDPVSSR